MENRNRNILVLKTSIVTHQEMLQAGMSLSAHPQIINWHIDLEDCDKVLRIECYGLNEADIAGILSETGIEADRLQ